MDREADSDNTTIGVVFVLTLISFVLWAGVAFIIG